MESIKGNVKEGEKKFALINTTDYNMDGNYLITTFSVEEANELGLDEHDVEQIKSLLIGQQALLNDYGIDAQVIRLA